MITGALILALGVLFWMTNGLVTLPSIVSTSTLARWQESSTVLGEPMVQVGVIIAAGLLTLLLWWLLDRRSRRSHDQEGR